MFSENEELEPKSKQQQKREAEAVQALGTAIVKLPATHFNALVAKLVLPDQLCNALTECRAIKAHEGRRRQLQYIGKLMRGIDAGPIQQVLASACWLRATRRSRSCCKPTRRRMPRACRS